MTEPVRKASRKSNLVPRREFEEYDYDDSIDTQTSSTKDGERKDERVSFEPQEILNQSLLPKIKDKISVESIYQPSTSVNFSVQVEVETFEEMEPSDDEAGPSYREESFYAVLSNEALRSETEKLMTKTTSNVDKVIEVEIRNHWGKHLRPVQFSYHDTKIQHAIQEWKGWRFQSKNRSSILAYKCYLCKIGWWNLNPFRDHIRLHEEINVSIDTVHNDCYLIAWNGKLSDHIGPVKIDGKCWQCLQKYEEHTRNAPPYICLGCFVKKPSCRVLFEHEGQCQRFQKIIFECEMATESLWTCEICDIACVSKKRYTEHMLLSHSPRSDLAVPFPTFQTCSRCNVYILNQLLHTCSERSDCLKCSYCLRGFQHKCLKDFHEKFTKKDYVCKVCRKILATHCRAAQHMVQHSKNYMMAYKCKLCPNSVLFAYKTQMHCHRLMQHKKKPGFSYETVIVPRSCMTSKWEDRDPFEAKLFDRPKPTPKTVDTPKPSSETNEVIKTYPSYMRVNKSDYVKVYTSTGNNLQKNTETDVSQDNSTSQASKSELTLLDNTLDTKDGILDVNDDDDVLIIDDGNVQNEVVIDVSDDEDGIGIKEEFNDESSIQKAKEGNIKDSDETNESKETIKIKQEIIEDSSNQDNKITYENVQDIIEVNDSSQDSIDVKKEKEDEANLNQDNIQVNDKINYDNLIQEHVLEVNGSSQHTIVIKQEKIDEDNATARTVASLQQGSTFENVKINTEVSIKEEKEDYHEFDDDITEEHNDIKADHEACLAELSKVFQATKRAGGSIELSRISSEDLVIKEESDDEYEDDIIKLHDDSYEMNTATYNSESDTSRNDSEANEEMYCKLEPEISLNFEQSESNDGYDKVVTRSGHFYDRKKPKQYGCTRCPFQGTHGEYQWHITNECLPTRKIERNKVKYKCTKCYFRGTHRAWRWHITNVCPRRKYRKNKKKGKKDKQKNKDNIHTVTQYSWKEYCCTKCIHTFNNMTTYVAHFRKHNLPFGTCPECLKTFTDASHAAAHLVTHIRTSFMKMQVLTTESYLTSKSSGLFQCRTCAETVGTENFFVHWENHLKLDKDNGEMLTEIRSALKPIYREDGLEETVLTPERLKLALDQLQSVPEPKKFVKECSLCLRKFDRKNDVKRHLIEHLLRDAAANGGIYLRLHCQVCRAELYKTDAYKVHMRNHGGLPIYKCEMCNRCFSDSSNFAKHKKTHNYAVMICDICEKKFQSRKGIEQHMIMHRTTEPIICSCSKKFYSAADYKRHLKSAHNKEGLRFICKVCRKKCLTCRDLWDHMWNGHGIRKFKADCPVCGKQFRKVNDVKSHLRTHLPIVETSRIRASDFSLLKF